jgi:hypothetical protein
MGDVTRDDLRELREDLSDQIRAGFERTDRVLSSIDARVATQNGNVARNAQAIAVQANRLEAHDREFRDIKAGLKQTGDQRRIALWDVYLVLGTIAAVVGVLKFFGRL